MIFRNILFIFSAIFIDQFSKYIIRSYGGFYICNKGVAFSLNLPAFLFWIIWIFIILLILCFLISNIKYQISNQIKIKKPRKKDIWILEFIWNNLEFGIWNFKFSSIGLLFMLSGATSNVIDRLQLNCVVDFINLPFWPVFNLADTFIVIGGIISVGQLLNLTKYYGFQNLIGGNRRSKK